MKKKRCISIHFLVALTATMGSIPTFSYTQEQWPKRAYSRVATAIGNAFGWAKRKAIRERDIAKTGLRKVRGVALSPEERDQYPLFKKRVLYSMGTVVAAGGATGIGLVLRTLLAPHTQDKQSRTTPSIPTLVITKDRTDQTEIPPPPAEDDEEEQSGSQSTVEAAEDTSSTAKAPPHTMLQAEPVIIRQAEKAKINEVTYYAQLLADKPLQATLREIPESDRQTAHSPDDLQAAAKAAASMAPPPPAEDDDEEEQSGSQSTTKHAALLSSKNQQTGQDSSSTQLLAEKLQEACRTPLPNDDNDEVAGYNAEEPTSNNPELPQATTPEAKQIRDENEKIQRNTERLRRQNAKLQRRMESAKKKAAAREAEAVRKAKERQEAEEKRTVVAAATPAPAPETLGQKLERLQAEKETFETEKKAVPVKPTPRNIKQKAYYTRKINGRTAKINNLVIQIERIKATERENANAERDRPARLREVEEQQQRLQKQIDEKNAAEDEDDDDDTWEEDCLDGYGEEGGTSDPMNAPKQFAAYQAPTLSSASSSSATAKQESPEDGSGKEEEKE